MTYELAKELKDAGFRVKPDGQIRLEDLIEACGMDEEKRPRMYNLYSVTHTVGNDIVNEWACNAGMSYGRTPEEAVAKLYIALYNKGNAKGNKD